MSPTRLETSSSSGSRRYSGGRQQPPEGHVDAGHLEHVPPAHQRARAPPSGPAWHPRPRRPPISDPMLDPTTRLGARPALLQRPEHADVGEPLEAAAAEYEGEGSVRVHSLARVEVTSVTFAREEFARIMRRPPCGPTVQACARFPPARVTPVTGRHAPGVLRSACAATGSSSSAWAWWPWWCWRPCWRPGWPRSTRSPATCGMPTSSARAAGYLLGTDTQGRDVLSRVLYGARLSLSVGLISQSVAVTLGVTPGPPGRATTAAGSTPWSCGWPTSRSPFRRSSCSSRWPPRSQPSLPVVFLVIGVVGWAGMARLVRSQVLVLKRAEFVLAAQALGAPDRRILLRHLLPNVRDPGHHRRHARHRRRDHGRGGALVRRARRPAAHAELGRDGGRRARPAPRGAVGLVRARASRSASRCSASTSWATRSAKRTIPRLRSER